VSASDRAVSMAVQNPRPVIEAEDVVGEQVTMPVADAARRQSRLK
jgi:hypothetical protein